jgi:hypothetical protein
MKNDTINIDDKVISVLDEPNEGFNDELPDEIDFSKLNRIDNPLNKLLTFSLEPDIATHFKSSKQLNQFLRLQIRSFAKLK